MISLQLKSNQFTTIELKPAHFNEWAFSVWMKYVNLKIGEIEYMISL